MIILHHITEVMSSRMFFLMDHNHQANTTLFTQVELTDVQKKYYRAILERNFSFLSMGATSNSNVPNLLNTMMELRKCCNHPYLITGTLHHNNTSIPFLLQKQYPSSSKNNNPNTVSS